MITSTMPRYGRADRIPGLEVLESRTLLDSTPLSSVLDFSNLKLQDDSDPTHILVRFKPDVLARTPVPAALPATTVETSLDLVPGLFEVALSPGTTVDSALAAYGADPRVQSVESDRLLTTSQVPNDTMFGQQWDLNNTGQTGGTPGADIHATGAWNVTTGNTPVVVAVMDTGIDYNHPDLYLNIWINQAEIPASRRANLIDVDGDGIITFRDLNDPRNQGPGKITDITQHGHIDASDILSPMILDSQGRDTGLGGWVRGSTQDGDTTHKDDLIGWNANANNNNPFDDAGHGTHVAGTIGAVGNNGTGVAGIDWNVQLMPVKFLNSNGNGSIGQFIAGLNYAVAHGARISNNSWDGAGNSSDLLDAIRNARAQGQIFVAAAGNSARNLDVNPTYPANFRLDNVVTVAATDANDQLASFSNYGSSSVDLGAPGVGILSTVPWGGYATNTGTSMAVPHVSGVLALVWGQHPDWSYSQVINQVLRTVDHIPSLAGKTVTGGRLDAAAAVGANPISTAPLQVVSSRLLTDAGTITGLEVVFDRAVDPATFTTSAVQVVGPGGRNFTVIGVRSVSSDGRTFDVALPVLTTAGGYVVTIGSSVKDRAGVALRPYQTSFTLTDPIRVTSSAVASLLPSGRAVLLLNVGQAIALASVRVQLNIAFPNMGDLYIHLQGPDGIDVVLMNRDGGSTANFSNGTFDDLSRTPISQARPPFNGSYHPRVSLANFAGRNARGTWKLWVENRGGSRGTVYGFSLILNPQPQGSTGTVGEAQVASLGPRLNGAPALGPSEAVNEASLAAASMILEKTERATVQGS
jgi:subtilisin family serine protease/subtilisin-like proprotein convertase family protein